MAQQTIDIGSSANDGTGDPIRDAFDKCNDNFTELYAGLVGLLDFKGSTDCSANPNYPAASKGDFYVVSVAGKIGGASGITVEVGDAYFAKADNAGGTQASVGSSWTVIQANIVGGTISELDDIPDVNAPSPSNGDVLTWDSTPGEWVPSPPSGITSFNLGDAGDVDTTDAAVGEPLYYDGTNWVSAGGTSFPGSPTSGQRFLRTDRNIEYFYDGTRWLSTFLVAIPLGVQDAVNPATANSSTMRAANPFFGVYDFYVEKCTVAYFPSATTAANYFTHQFRYAAAAGNTNLGGTISTQSVTQNAWGAQSVSPNAVAASTAIVFELTFTETGTASSFTAPTIYGRLVG